MTLEEHQKEFLELLAKVWSQYPQWRFGQLIDNLMGYLNAPPLFYAEDMELFTRMELLQKLQLNKTKGAQTP